ncbi:ROK family protein [Candidatus Pelagibacter sp. RS39]|uniref:ROK family protein n=1 Tax=Candidatus Pelagibacter sp. RS39 TaxID=1977864 RepID=UPI000A14E125|nr:ROK family protein [Candidatus Pelagibacter sp. RS39]ARJ48084.1 transcriptional regulator [Candidatus Pelagibacter sp. RS39]
MQIGIDLGASKIEYVLLDDVGNEHHRERTEVPKNYKDTLSIIKKIVIELERKAGKELPVGVCHPGIHSIQTGLVKNAPNSFWINGKPLQRDLRSEIGKEIYCENDANCFALSEAIDGSGKHYKIVFGVILGSGVGGGLVIDKRIVNGPNGITGEWGHNQIPSACIEGVQIKKTNLRAGEIENFVAGIGISKAFKNEFKKDLSAQKIFEMHRKLDLDAEKLIDKYKDQLAMSLATVVNIIDPDVFVFGGGVSNEINFLDEIKQKMKKFVAGGEFEGTFLKPKFGDASGVRGAARLARTANH